MKKINNGMSKKGNKGNKGIYKWNGKFFLPQIDHDTL